MLAALRSEALLSPTDADSDAAINSTLVVPASSTASGVLNSSPPSPSPAAPPYRLLFGVRHPPGALLSFSVLFAIHLLNYMDRLIPSAVKTQLQDHYGLNDFESAFPLTAFIIVFMLSCPLFGALADKGYSRRRIISGAVICWSLLTAATAVAPNYASLVIIRASVGIGESSYIVITPAILADWYLPDDRNTMLGLWNLAIPLGAALGYGLGGVLGDAFGWQVAFLVLGIPGIALGVLVLYTAEPPRGNTDPVLSERRNLQARSQSQLQVLRLLLSNPYFVCAALGQCLNTFGVGAMSDWFPTYLMKRLQLSESEAGLGVGAVTVVGGIGGSLLGPYLASRLSRVVSNSYLAVAGWSSIVAALLAILVFQLYAPYLVLLLLLALAQISLWCYLGPVWALLSNTTHPLHRTRAFALAAFAEHLLGDAASPSIIGAVSDRAGLAVAVTIIPFAWICAGIVWVTGSRLLRDAGVGALEDGDKDGPTAKLRLEDDSEGGAAAAAANGSSHAFSVD